MKIGKIDTKTKVAIIAEIGNNHEGNYALAEEMIGLAAESGADVVKFQTIVPEKLISISQKDRLAQLKKYQLSYSRYRNLSKIASQNGLEFLSTPFDIESAIFLDELVPAFKISSGDNTFYPLLNTVAKTGKPIILSTGFQNLIDVRSSVEFINNIWKLRNIQSELALLHCVSIYPTSPEQANLFAVRELQNIVETVGYSDHTLGINAAILSVAAGARIIEKHFTISKHQSEFRDHKLSADPKEMKQMVEQIRFAEKLLGSGIKEAQVDEAGTRESVRRSIVAVRNLSIGHVIKLEDLGWVRPGNGLAPGKENRIIGKKLRMDVKEGQQINLSMVY